MTAVRDGSEGKYEQIFRSYYTNPREDVEEFLDFTNEIVLPDDFEKHIGPRLVE